MPELINADLVALDVRYGDTKDDVIRALAGLVAAAGRSKNARGLAEDVLAREAQSSTGIRGGLAIPHCRSAYVLEETLTFARLSPGVDFGSHDGPADLVFLIAAPVSGSQEHMRLLTRLARALVGTDFTHSLRIAGSEDEVVRLVSAALSHGPAAQPAAQAGTTSAPTGTDPSTERPVTDRPVTDRPVADGASADRAVGPTAADDGPGGGDSAGTHASTGGPGSPEPMTIVAVTACPTGIAHTYMAAEALEAAGRKAGVNVVVEPQGSLRAEPVDPAVIRSASAVIFATDIGVRSLERFGGLPEISSSVTQGIHEADDLVARAVAAAGDPGARRVPSPDSGRPTRSLGRPPMTGGLGTKLRTALLTGVSYMIPFVAAGGLLIALGYLFGGYEVGLTHRAPNFSGTLGDYVVGRYKLWDLPPASLSHHALFHSGLTLFLGSAMYKLGGLAFGFLVPALAGYIAFAIADRPGIAPGFAAGAVAVYTNAGFIGGIIAGLMAGVVALWFARLEVPRFVRGLMPVVIIPLVATLVTGLLMLFILARPLAWVTEQLQSGLSDMNGSSAVLLGIVVGLMMCFDLGGPVNKAAYLFATAGLGAQTTANFRVMAAVMLAGMVPPLAMALATTVRPALFTAPELENGRAAWLLGASFISEGAIPFAAADPIRVIPSVMAGGAVTGALSELLHVGLHAPHGGVFVLFAVDNKLPFLIALVAGTLVAAAMVITLKQMRTDDGLADVSGNQLVHA